MFKKRYWYLHPCNILLHVFVKQVELESKKKKPSKSLYARATDTGVDPREAAKRMKIDWDTAAEIDDADSKDETEVPPVLVCYYTFPPNIRLLFLKSTLGHNFNSRRRDKTLKAIAKFKNN